MPKVIAHDSFELIRQQRIDTLNLDIEHYRHRVTGAEHYHLAADNDENVFLVGLRTVPDDSSGVAHILEHTALCGSDKYPVRDPFFMMIRRSLNTFMNAFTSSDWTAYPFASQNRKDFDNLLEVYLDAVFCSRLDPLDFAQEGHRIEFSEAENADSPLEFKGVVFNEMKGAMSSVPATLWQTLSKYLFPTTTYHHNSGGEPECIPNLSYDELRAFYQSHYHPSNAIFMTFGNIPAHEHQQKFEQLALHKFQALDETIAVGCEQRFNAPLKVEEFYALDDGDSKAKSHVVLGWLWGQNTNLDDMLEAQLLSGLLLDNSASPLRQALETSELGTAPSPLCGLEDSNHELTFACGIEGTEPEHTDAIEALILSTLRETQQQGFEQQQVDAVLHQLELHQREIGGDGYPYGLQLIMQILSTAAHRGDPISMLDLDPALEKLRQRASDPSYITDLIERLLLNNQHRVTLVMKPDTNLSERRNSAEALRLATIKAAMSDEEKQQVIEQTKALNARQLQQDDESILPKVGLEDVPANKPHPEYQQSQVADMTLSQYAVGCNGITYQQIIVELPKLSQRECDILPYYCRCVTELGIGNDDYLITQQRQANLVGSISAFTSLRGKVDDEQDVRGYFVLSSKALSRNHLAQSALMLETFEEIKFNEHSRIRELIAQARGRREQGITGNGHGLAMLAASSRLSPISALSHRASGLEGLQVIKALDDSLKDDTNLANFAAELAQLHTKLIQCPRQLLELADQENLLQSQEDLATLWQPMPAQAFTPFSLPATRDACRQVWAVNSQVNFCAKAYPTVPVDHEDAAPLTVLGGFLRNGFLHRAIREQGGAYGAGASQESSQAVFRFFSYRDPRTEETLTDFDQSIQWLLDTEHEWQKVEEAILGVIGSLDKPSSPAGEAKSHFHNELFNRSPEQRQRFRSRILTVTSDDLKRVARQYLIPENESLVIVTNANTAEQLGDFIKQQRCELIKV